MTIREWMEQERELEATSSEHVVQLQSKYFNVINALLDALHSVGYNLDLEPVQEDNENN